MSRRDSVPTQLIVYGLCACSTCDKARAWLLAAGIAHHFVDYRQAPVAPAMLLAWAESLGWEKLVNRASYTWRDLPVSRKNPETAEDWLALIAEYPALIKRPVVVGQDGVQVGFSEKRFAERFGAV